jgi:hypothetical protein
MNRLAAFVLGVLLLLSTRVHAQVVLDRTPAAGLVRRDAFLYAGQSLTVFTSGCTGTADTVVYLLQTTSTPGTLITRGWSDDASGTFCSGLFYTNTTGADQSYVVVVAAYDATRGGTATLTIQVNSSQPRVETLTFGGARANVAGWIATPSADFILTKPLRDIDGIGGPSDRGIEDTYLFAVNLVLGSASYVDDDSGGATHSRIMPLASCSSSQCDIVAGGFYEAEQGNVTTWIGSTLASNNSDTDGISNSIEAFYGTNPTQNDSDNDGILDGAELLWVVGSAGLNGAESTTVILPYQDSDPVQQDVFFEVDWMVGDSNHSHAPFPAIAADLVGIFTNDSAWTGRYIRPHFEVSQVIGEYTGIDFGNCSTNGVPGRLNFYSIKNNPSFFLPTRKSIYHYVIAGHSRFKNTAGCPIIASSGVAEILGNDVIVTLAFSETAVKQRGTYVHEGGHNLALLHHANADDSDNPNKGNWGCVHTSPMNYRYQLTGWGTTSIPSLRRFSYSRGLCDATGPNGSCSNTCVNRCVPSGQLTPKGACGSAGTTGPWVSNGTCDCDFSEWTSELNLKFQGDPDAQNGAGAGVDATFGIPKGKSAEWIHPYLMGVGSALTAEHRGVTQAKAAFLRGRGAREGVDFIVRPENGKLYSSD